MKQLSPRMLVNRFSQKWRLKGLDGLTAMKMKSATVLLDLTQSEEDLWKAVHSKNRWSVRKARKKGVTFHEGGDHDECYDLYRKMCAINLVAPIPRHILFKLGRLFTVKLDGQVVAFSVIVEDQAKKRAVHEINASDYETRETQANSLLYWEFIRAYQDRGFQEIDLGGIDLHAEFNEGPDRFKKRWGGQVAAREHDVGILHYAWWRYLRHHRSLRVMKMQVQMLGQSVRRLSGRP